MQDYFIWNGTDCRDYGIHVTEQPPITIPSERSTQTNVPGRPGSLTQLEGEDVYDDLLLTATCFISDPTQIPAIATWLKGAGTVTFANRTGGYYKARIANQISFEKVLRGNPHCTFAVNFRCYPFFYADAAADITVTTSGTIITNPGSVYSEPILTVYGSGDITLMVGTTIVELEDISGSIVLAENAYMRANYLGDYLSSTSAFTVEGWLKWDGATRGGEVTVCGMYDSTANSTGGRIGWKLIIDDTGAEPLFGIYARSGYKYTPMAKGLFAERPVRPGTWQHVALTYDPKAGTRGVWTLYVNGRVAGSVENSWYDATKPAANAYFKFGRMNDVSATGFSGGLDMWRISSGVLGPESLLFQRNSKFTVTIR